MSLTPEDPLSFGQLLRRHVERSPKYRTQEQFAAAIDKEVTSVRHWFSDRGKPSKSSFRQVLTWLYGSDRTRHAAERKELTESYVERPDKDALIKQLLASPSTRKLWTDLLKAYEGAPHPLVRQAFVKRVELFLRSLDFGADRAPSINHKEFSFLAAGYIEQGKPRIRAMTRANVTNWEPLFSSGSEYLRAQRGLDVQRVFVLESLAHYQAFARDILPAHADAYGAANVLICSARHALELIESLPGGSSVGPSQDFALIGDLVAFCPDQERVVFRTDMRLECERIFAAIAGHVLRREQSFADLGTQGADRVFD